MTADVDDALARAARAVDGARVVSLACHVSPDGDALGSMLGLFHVLRAAGREVVASFPSPFVVAPHYRDLPGLDLLTKPEDFPAEPEVMVTFDCGSLGRLGNLQASAEAAHELVVLDHHVSNTRYGSINVIDPDAAASGVLVRRLVAELGLGLDDAAAISLYAALVCDTGRFQYDTSTPDVFGLARELVEFDVPISRLSRQLFEEHRFAYLQLLSEALANAQLDVEHRFVWTAVTQDMLERHGVTLDEVEGLIDILRRTTEAEVTCVLKQEPNGKFRVSLRSLGDVDVRAIASQHEGGGHRFAAGFESTLDLDRLVGSIRDAL
jgi:phosphoesterase RecJ-like protein